MKAVQSASWNLATLEGGQRLDLSLRFLQQLKIVYRQPLKEKVTE